MQNAKCKMQNAKCKMQNSSPCHRVTVLPCHLVTLSPCHLVTVSSPHRVTVSPPHRVTAGLHDRLLATHVEDVDTLTVDVEPDPAAGRHVERRRRADLDDRIADAQVEDRA